MINIEIFNKPDTDAVIKLVLHFQNDGTRPLVSVADQPDLLRVEEEYIEPGGCFWVARDNGKVVGSIGLMPYTDTLYILKKFFVYEPYQGKPHHLGQQLYRTLLDFARTKNVKTILLDTPRNTTRAHRFYEKAGFRQIAEDELSITYSHPYRDSDFFILEL